ncbi:MAG: DUF4442 domain-containing protein [Mariprofundaceae bacterium]
MKGSSLQFLSQLTFLSDSRRFELYPPFWMMRVKVEELASDWSHARIRLPLNWVSANAGQNMFGGYQASLADPVPAFACLRKFPSYRVMTKSLAIDFVRVGNSDLLLHFDFSAEQETLIAKELEEKGRATPCFEMHYCRSDGQVATRIRNTVAIRPVGYMTNK